MNNTTQTTQTTTEDTMTTWTTAEIACAIKSADANVPVMSARLATRREIAKELRAIRPRATVGEMRAGMRAVKRRNLCL